MNLSWFACGAVVIGALVSIFRPDNTAFPFSLSTRTRAFVAVALGATQAALQAIYAGTSWQEAVTTALAAVFTAWFAHGARGVIPVTLCLLMSGCGYFTPAHVADIVAIESCVLNEWWVVSPGRMPTIAEAETIAVKCGAQDWRQVLDLISVHRAAAVREGSRMCE